MYFFKQNSNEDNAPILTTDSQQKQNSEGDDVTTDSNRLNSSNLKAIVNRIQILPCKARRIYLLSPKAKLF